VCQLHCQTGLLAQARQGMVEVVQVQDGRSGTREAIDFSHARSQPETNKRCRTRGRQRAREIKAAATQQIGRDVGNFMSTWHQEAP
jgi:hypothetical protein